MLVVIVKVKERTDTRASMVRGAASLIRTRGVNATSFSDVLAESGAPRGSIYHHFPKGKDQLAGDAIRWTSERVLAHQRECRATTPGGVLDCFVDMWRQVVLTSDGAAGCVVAGVAIDTTADDRATIVPARRASRIAVATVAGMEGALILCRAEGSSASLETVAAELKRLLPPEVR